MYIYSQHTDSLLIFGDNKPYNFTVVLPKRLNLQGRWGCALKELYLECGQTSTSHAFVCSDICEPSFVNGEEVSVLRGVELGEGKSVKVSHIFQQPFYIPLSKKEINSITITLRRGDSALSLATEVLRLRCTLHLTQTF
jgi:hypothetical protein